MVVCCCGFFFSTRRWHTRGALVPGFRPGPLPICPRHTIGCALIAGQGDGMQRDGWYTTAVAEDGLETPVAVGRRAAERTAARLQPRSIATATMPVLFSAEMARSLVGHLLGAVSGGALYRKASFLLDSAGTKLFPDWFAIDELPFLPRGLRSAAFDAEGVATRESALVREGVLQRYVLGSYSARKLGLSTTGNAGGVHNLQVAANTGSLDEMLRGMGRGLLVRSEEHTSELQSLMR